MKKKDTFSLPLHPIYDPRSQSASFLNTNNLLHKPNEPAGFQTLHIPGSKSISNRAILLASLARGTSHLQGILYSEDTAWMIKICRQLGAQIKEPDDKSLVIDGLAGRFGACTDELYVGNAGTCARFLCAALVRGTGTYILRGSSRMHERPIADLITVLRLWGARIECLEKEGFLPLKIEVNENILGGHTKVPANISSQFLSALLMLAPFTTHGAEIEVVGDFVSSSYARMTYSMMRSFGVSISNLSPSVFCIAGQQEYVGCDFKVPGDASSASYFFALAAITGSKIQISNLEESPVQSDLHFVNLLELMGCEVEFEGSKVRVQGKSELRGIRVDMHDMSDVVPTLAIVAMCAEGVTDIYHIAHIRGKECDRISALCCELRKLGAKVTEYSDGLSIEAPKQFVKDEVLIRTYDDHRIAMAFAILAKRIPNIHLEDPNCVVKTYPNFFEDLESLCTSARHPEHSRGAAS